MHLLEGTRIGTLLHTILQLSGLPLFTPRPQGPSLFRSIEFDYFSSNGSDHNSIESPSPHVSTRAISDPDLKCYGNLTCLHPTYPQLRGFTLWPLSLEEITPNVCLFKLGSIGCSKITPDSGDFSSIIPEPFQVSYWVTHGYLENGHISWVKEMVEELINFKGKDAGVFVIDWGRGAEPPYAQATVNIELLGIWVGDLMIKLEDAGRIRLNSTHFIGHSLGAHFAGFTGAFLNGKGRRLGRISGLDPANPYFQNYPPDARLDASDGIFVDVIHTDAKPLLHGGTLTGLGTRERSGHADFFPNSGKDQPGCKDGVYQAILQEDGSLIHGLRRMIVCDHIRAYEYFIESIRSPCPFAAYACPSWRSFLTDPFQCHISTNQMGFHARMPSNETAYYSITGMRSPYCRFHYRVSIKTDLHIPPSVPDLLLLILQDNGDNLFLNLDMRDTRKRVGVLEWVVGGQDLALRNSLGPFRALLGISGTNSPFWWILNRMMTRPELSILSVEVVRLEPNNEKLVFCSDQGSNSLSFSDKSQPVLLNSENCRRTPPPIQQQLPLVAEPDNKRINEIPIPNPIPLNQLIFNQPQIIVDDWTPILH